ncbi:MAG: PSD1 domain-containing protein [Undibacterium sp.]|nr:PSD1 domain-containing protein [Opitutaceae bacterium]
MNFAKILCAGAVLTAAATAAEIAVDPPASREDLQFFENEIRPLLAGRCYKCHGEEKQKGGLRLDHITTMLKGGDTGPALERGQPEKSLLLEAIRYKNEDLQMPPKEELPAREVALLEKWVALGAPWPAGDVARKTTDEHGFTAEARAFWYFQPLTKPVPPQLTSPSGERWVRGDIDRFVAAKHAEFGLTPAAPADRAELARRVYFDLHGLPPTRAQLEEFAGDPDPRAYERLVDALLASPRYGERWAQHWLDLVRYAESDGYRADGARPGAWLYRDYVIKSLNADKPYDQFVREQLAGDEIAPENPDVLIATSYLRNPVYEWNQRDVRGQADLVVTDMTDNAGEVFLGLSMGCARCHDHKFDPILQKDYFALRAFFEPVLWRTDLKLATHEEERAFAEKQRGWENATADIRQQMEALVGPAREKLVQTAYKRFTDDIRAMMDKPATAREPLEHILATMAERQLEQERVAFDVQKALKLPADRVRHKQLEAELKKFDGLKPKPISEAFVATDAGPKAPATKLKTKQGELEIAPAFLTLIETKEPAIKPLAQSTGRRTALADWITRPDNQLSTRVIVNRVWQYHFGHGIAGTPNDLGHLGERPTHPELLDWLAQSFVAEGWSLKRLHREILLSATYQQTARAAVPAQAALVDPLNKYLWRFSPRRLDAEQARDAMLAASGELDLTAGGVAQDGQVFPRRSIYAQKKRNNQNDLLRSLDAPPGFTSIADRQNTSTAIQALLFMNGDWVLSRARKLAARAPTVEVAWAAALGRSPTADEAKMATEFIARRVAVTPPATLSALAVLPAGPGSFRENTTHERVITKGAPREGDEFTVEAVFTLASADEDNAVRTIASRWTGDKGSEDGHGWSLGINGRKAPVQPLGLVMQLVGEDDNMNTTYEFLPAGLTLKTDTPYHVVAKVSCAEHTVTFRVQDLNSDGAPLQTAVVRHAIVGKIARGTAAPVIGGLARRTYNQFDGDIAAVRIAAGLLPDSALSADPETWRGDAFAWVAARDNGPGFEWAGGTGTADSADPRQRAMGDLCHVLLNSNEFLYLH